MAYGARNCAETQPVTPSVVLLTVRTLRQVRVPPEYYAGDRELYRAMIENNRERVSPDGRISAEAATLTWRNLAAFEDTIKNARIDVAKTYDNTFIERAPKLRAQ